MKKLFFAWILALIPVTVLASGAAIHLDRVQNVQGDKAALQEGAALFINYCLNCHGASYFRYNKLQELGLTKEQIEQNLMFSAEKIGEPMRVAARTEESKKWFGAAPPDLTIIARARASGDGSGADWLYTYLRSFYRDPMRPTGWNNVIFENVGMPHALWALQGEQVLQEVAGADPEKKVHKLVLASPGSLSAADYDKKVTNLVGFMVWMGEPDAGFRQKVGIGVLIFLSILLIFAYALKKEYWKDVH